MEVARKKVYPALVNITVVARFFRGGRSLRSPAGGSGAIVSPEGHVLTNFHVAGHTTRITCTLPSGEALDASVVAHDPLTDLSVLKLHTEKRANGGPLPYAKLGNSDQLEVGDRVLAMGNPLMLSSSMTLGIVSNTKRVFTDFIGTEIEDQDLETGEKTGVFTRWIQHDALILPGNSGGPLVNLAGDIVGINELGGNGVGFAIPSNIAANVLKQALAFGEVKRGWIGLTVLPVDKLGKTTGALVASVMPASPAEKAGIKPGDIITELDSQATNVRFFEEVPLFYQRIAALTIGQTSKVTFDHAGTVHTVLIPVKAMEKFNGEEDEVRPMGLTAEEITTAIVMSNRFPNKKGVLVTGIRMGYPLSAASPKVAEGDVITSVDGVPTDSISALKTAFKTKKENYLIAFHHNAENMVVVAKSLKDQPLDDSSELPKAWLGVKTQVLTSELSKAMAMPGIRGFRVTQVYPATEASKAGLKSGDIITMINKTKLAAYRPQDSDDLKHAIEDLGIGDKATITVTREGKSVVVPVVMESPPAPVERAKRVKQTEFEFNGRDITEIDKFENRWSKSQTGVLVTDVTQGGWAAMAGLRIEDVVLELNSVPVTNADAFEKQMTALLKAKPKVFKIFVMRGSGTHFVFIEPDWSKLTSGP